MNTYEFIELVEHPEDQGDYIPPEIKEDLKLWQFELLEQSVEDAIKRELELQDIIEDILAA